MKNKKKKINWKKVLLFILLFIISFLIYSFILLFTSPILFLILFTLNIILLISILIKFARWKFLTIIALLIIVLLIFIVPFPECDSWGKFNHESQTCDCKGIKIYELMYDAGRSECIGIPTNYQTINASEEFNIYEQQN